MVFPEMIGDLKYKIRQTNNLLFHLADNCVWSVSWDDLFDHNTGVSADKKEYKNGMTYLWIMQHIKLLSSVSSSIKKDSFLPSRVIRKELYAPPSAVVDFRTIKKRQTFVTSNTCPSIITQTSSFLLCLATSSAVYAPPDLALDSSFFLGSSDFSFDGGGAGFAPKVAA
jgi:hypothetical protein